MSTDKLRTLQNTLAEIFRESPLISTNIEPSPPTFFDEEPHDAAQQRGEVASVDDGRRSSRTEELKPIVSDIDLTHK
jgi:hypothetical protein